MRILHLADPHVDAARHGWRNPLTGQNTAIESNLACFDHVMDQAMSQDVDAVVIAGDIWNSGRPSSEMIARVTDKVYEVTQHGIPVVAEDGNHGRHGVHLQDRGPADLLERAGAVVYGKTAVYTLDTKSGPLHVLGVPWPERSRILSDMGMTDLSDPAAVDAACAGWVAQEIEDAIEDAGLTGGEPLIASSHITVSEGTLSRGSETVVNTRGIFEEITLPLGVFTDAGADYIALGHIHHQQHHGKASYAGSLNRLTFGEAEDVKGGLLVEVTPGGDPVRTLVETPARNLLNLRLDKNPEPDLTALLPGTLVKPHLAPGEREVPQHIREAIKAAGGVIMRVKTTPAVQDATQMRQALAEDISPAEALSKWAGLKGLDEAAVADLTARARKVMSGCAA